LDDVAGDIWQAPSVRSFAAAFCGKALPLHGIICCAGVIMHPYSLSRDGLETHFAVGSTTHDKVRQTT